MHIVEKQKNMHMAVTGNTYTLFERWLSTNAGNAANRDRPWNDYYGGSVTTIPSTPWHDAPPPTFTTTLLGGRFLEEDGTLSRETLEALLERFLDVIDAGNFTSEQIHALLETMQPLVDLCLL